jgi:hypothetical protein
MTPVAVPASATAATAVAIRVLAGRIADSFHSRSVSRGARAGVALNIRVITATARPIVNL